MMLCNTLNEQNITFRDHQNEAPFVVHAWFKSEENICQRVAASAYGDPKDRAKSPTMIKWISAMIWLSTCDLAKVNRQETWDVHIDETVSWLGDNWLGSKAKTDGRKYISHLGGILLDSCVAELYARAGQPVQGHRVVFMHKPSRASVLQRH